MSVLKVNNSALYGYFTAAEETYFFLKQVKTNVDIYIGKSIGIGKSNQQELVT